MLCIGFVCFFVEGTYVWHCVCLFFVGVMLGIGFVCFLVGEFMFGTAFVCFLWDLCCALGLSVTLPGDFGNGCVIWKNHS